jgi:hypothetical protein
MPIRARSYHAGAALSLFERVGCTFGFTAQGLRASIAKRQSIICNAFPCRTLPKRTASGWLTSSVLLIGLLATVSGSHADTVPDWNLITAKMLETAKAGTGLAHSRVYAMVHGAIFDAVNAIDRRYHSYAADLEVAPGASQEVAAAAAAHTVLVELYPLQQATLDAALAASLAKIQDGQPKIDGIALG